MSEENYGFWSEEQIEEWEHNRWLKMQEMGGHIYDPNFNKDKKDDKETEGNPFEEEERRRWQKEEKEAKQAYFQMIKEEEERGYFRKTLSELIEEESEPPDSLTDIDASIQKTNLESLQAVVEMEQRGESESSQELDVGLQLHDTDQVIEYHFDDKEVEERNEEEVKRTTKASTLMSWLRKMWTAPTGTQSRVQHEEKEDPRTGPHKDPDEADEKNIGPMHKEKRFS